MLASHWGGIRSIKAFFLRPIFSRKSVVLWEKNISAEAPRRKLSGNLWSVMAANFFSQHHWRPWKNWSSKRDLAGPTDWNRLAITAKYCSNHSSNCSFLLETYRSVRESRYVIDKAKTRPFTRSKYKSRPCLSVNTRWIFLLVKSNSRTRRIYGLRQITVVFSRGYGQSSKGVNCSMDIYNDLGCCVAIQMV